MAQNKLENQIREKLNSREIQPSAQSWDRLDAMLTVAEEKKAKRSFFSYGFIGIAASVLVFVTLGLFYFNQENTVIESQSPVVETEIKKENTEETTNSGFVTSSAVEKSNSESIVSNETRNSQSATRNSQPERVSIINQNQDKIVLNKEVIIPKEEEKTTKKTTIIDVDELLASVEKDRKPVIKINKSDVKVDVKTLLSEVDTELDMTFRERVLKTINKNYKSVKEAVVNRNH